MALPEDRYSDKYDDDRGGYGDRDRGRRDDYDYEPRRFRKEDVPNYIVPGVLAALFCCTIGGIVTVVYAAQANTKAAAGDYEGAMQAANTAKTWLWVSVITGVVIQPLVIYLQIVAQNPHGF
jgi:hypothetical protein